MQSQILSLELEIPELDKKRTLYKETKDNISRLQGRGIDLQQESRAILNELLEANMMLSSMSLKVRSIASELADCGYFRTRREIAAKLRDILEGFQKDDTKNGIAQAVASIVSKLVEVEGRTRKVLMIMQAA